MFAVRINTVLNGWVVEVGCQTLVFVDRACMLTAVEQYLTAPDASTKRFLTESVNANLVAVAAQGGEDVPEVPPAYVSVTQREARI